MGIFFAQQEVEQIPVEPHDIPLPHVVTENGWRKLL
jgi:5-formyltetrahydrofolate cyclo-ligase